MLAIRSINFSNLGNTYKLSSQGPKCCPDVVFIPSFESHIQWYSRCGWLHLKCGWSKFFVVIFISSSHNSPEHTNSKQEIHSSAIIRYYTEAIWSAEVSRVTSRHNWNMQEHTEVFWSVEVSRLRNASSRHIRRSYNPGFTINVRKWASLLPANCHTP